MKEFKVGDLIINDLAYPEGRIDKVIKVTEEVVIVRANSVRKEFDYTFRHDEAEDHFRKLTKLERALL